GGFDWIRLSRSGGESGNDFNPAERHGIDHPGCNLAHSGHSDSTGWNRHTTRRNRNPSTGHSDSWSNCASGTDTTDNPIDNSEFDNNPEHDSELRHNSGDNTEHESWTMHGRGYCSWLHDPDDTTSSG